MFTDIEVEELLAKQQQQEMTLIDVRSQSEFEESTIPGSLNIPFFNDEERAEIGTLYKQVSVEAAKKRGLAIISAKLPALIEQFQEIQGNKVVFCWRGGMRSRTTATLLSLMDVHVQRLSGGIRSYRKWVVDELSQFEVKPKALVLNGYTGTGKTYILRKLQAEQYPVLDLEQMAGHRGSVFGQVGLRPHNQKTFDSLLLQALLKVQDRPYMLLEAESKRIGKVAMPEFLVKSKEEGMQLWIDLPIEERVKQILEDYQPELHQDACLAAFRRIKERMHTPIAKQIEEDLQAGRFGDAAEQLLIHYYDPRYEHTAREIGPDNLVMIKADNVDDALAQVKQYISEPIG
ncbi:tRNA 2-selenouridine(34) synthase MnmH [Paenibacillus physcomitrellae]|uniref:tRNA 2-selenouridine synthase n=1 Tax=Paenibacillus physcomitrellae TaxID=1619311 RepID=A0ABQ1GZF7_9BACL|nr:tRNA 2-selenouridine(34) synthase MnmH [Paenibacillus physcomitrellae]GGA52430.1 tRNA 2-selenouridine synthase [Paenibacillus physcomitrellae]